MQEEPWPLGFVQGAEGRDDPDPPTKGNKHSRPATKQMGMGGAQLCTCTIAAPLRNQSDPAAREGQHGNPNHGSPLVEEIEICSLVPQDQETQAQRSSEPPLRVLPHAEVLWKTQDTLSNQVERVLQAFPSAVQRGKLRR